MELINSMGWADFWFWAFTIQGFMFLRFGIKMAIAMKSISDLLPEIETEIIKRETAFQKNLKKVRETEERERYLLKAMNDSMSVLDVKGFLAQRMSNTPKHWEPISKENINPDKIVS